MLRKVILLMTVILLAVSACPAAYAGTDPVRFSDEEDEKKASEYYKKADENIVSAYYNAMDVVQSGHAGDFRKGKSVGEWFFTVFYSAYASVKRAAPFIAMVSILLGSTICFFAKRNKMVFRRALFVFVLGVPFVLVLVVFGIGSMTTVFG